MIEVRQENLVGANVECILRSVGSNLEPLTTVGKEVEVAAGEDLLERMEKLGDLPVGGAVITPAGDLSASFIVHIALRSHDEPISVTSVRKALLNGLRHASRMGVETMALPPLGTGAGNLDAGASAEVILEVLREHMQSEEYPREVTVMVSTDYELQAFDARLTDLDPEADEPAVD